MTVHSAHPDSHEFGLADDCERCREHSLEPLLGLDDTNIANLMMRIHDDLAPRSLNEAAAMGCLREELRKAERLTEIFERGR